MSDVVISVPFTQANRSCGVRGGDRRGGEGCR